MDTYRIQYRTPGGRVRTHTLTDPAEVRALADEARTAAPGTHEIRIRRATACEITGDFLWADVTADFS